jgi:hypothetical protein
MHENNVLPGYHLATIHKGELGEVSKILEEIEELIDAEAQGCRVMAIVELADIVGAINAYLEKRSYGITIADLEIMASITKRAFVNGHRT